jgi:hypothetical protein
VPVGYDSPRSLIALGGVACVIYGVINLSLIPILIGGAVLAYFAFLEK